MDFIPRQNGSRDQNAEVYGPLIPYIAWNTWEPYTESPSFPLLSSQEVTLTLPYFGAKITADSS